MASVNHRQGDFAFQEARANKKSYRGYHMSFIDYTIADRQP